MGLLTDSKKRKRLSVLVLLHYRKLIIFTFLAGLLWFTLLASDYLNNKTYFSENALLPGLVVREFSPGSNIGRILADLKEEAQSHASLPYTWILAQFRQLGLDVYTQNFTLHYPFGAKLDYVGNNLYAILRAPKSCSTEAVVLSTPFRGFNTIHDVTLPSIALMLELAKAFRRKQYWSKDIIFLITEHEMVGFQAWLDSYHRVTTSQFIEGAKLRGSSGQLQAVINLEITTEKMSHIDIKIEGLNGQLPNLDLFNLAVELCARENVLTTFQSKFNFYSSSPSYERWKHNFLTMVSMMGMQATGLPTGGHGLFHRYGIQAITLVSKFETFRSPKASLVNVGRVLEGIVRSLNNLLEKFHQSFFFYLLPSTRRYVSIGLYMAPFAFVVAPVLIRALYLYLHVKNSESEKDTLESIASQKTILWASLDVIIITHSFGSLMYFSPTMINYFQHLSSFSLKESVYYIHVILMFLSLIFICIYNRKCPLSYEMFHAKLCVVLLELAAFLFTLSLINISLATVLALFYVPVSITMSYQRKMRILHGLLVLFINPFMLTYLVIVFQAYNEDADALWWKHFTRGYEGHQKAILYTIEDMYFYGNWNYRTVTLALYPLWLELWMLGHARLI